MPGVPSYRGCDACRKQKKKCDQKKPACTRCARLKISCVGSGQQRFKFKDESRVVALPKGTARQSRERTNNIWPSNIVPASFTPPQPLSNSVTLTASAFIALLQINDPRYDMSTLGGFLERVPKRLGTNAALDASVMALASAFPHAGTRDPPPDTIFKYTKSLKALRSCLQDPATMRSPETLCAIYFVMISQGWVGGCSAMLLDHAQAMVYLLSTTPLHGWRGSFELELLVALSTLVIFESMFNTKIQLHPWLDRVAELYGPIYPIDCADGEPIGGFNLLTFSALAEHFRYPERKIQDVAFIYEQLRELTSKMRLAVEKLDEPQPSNLKTGAINPSVAHLTKLATRCQICLAMVLTIVLTFNKYLRAAGYDNGCMEKDTAQFADDMVVLARIAASRQPIGSGYIPVCLLIAWCTVDDGDQKIQIQQSFGMYPMDMLTSPGKEMLQSLRSCFNEAHERVVEARKQGLLNLARDDELDNSGDAGSAENIANACCIL